MTSDPLERAVERGTQRRLLAELHTLRAALAAKEAEIAKLAHRLEYDSEFGRRLCVENENFRTTIATLQAQLASAREALGQIETRCMNARNVQIPNPLDRFIQEIAAMAHAAWLSASAGTGETK
jgi:molybdopterin converting factor small subunit